MKLPYWKGRYLDMKYLAEFAEETHELMQTEHSQDNWDFFAVERDIARDRVYQIENQILVK